MKSKKVTGILLLLVVIIVVSVFTVTIAGIAAEVPNTTVTAEPTEEIGIEKLQQSVYDRGYNYAVRKNWITALSPEERQNLCGYKPLKPPTGPLPENVHFRSMVEIPKSERSGLPPVGQPQAYDAMALGYVTPVKNQSACGSCWLFGAIADFESDVLINESHEFNFSEQEVGDCNIWSSVGGHDFCEGGTAFMTTNYFTKYGAADEACHPYAVAQETCQNCTLLKNVDNWRMITGDDGESQISTIKNAIQTYGPVHSSIYASDPGFKAYDSGVYEYWGAEEMNHAIEIIGWNDSLPHSQGTGAWLIKNSYGTDWGASGPYPGCAWVAYGAANLGDFTSAIASYKIPSDVIFYHDECGWMGYCTGCDDPTAYVAVRFTPSQDNMNLTAVDFWAVDANMEYEIKIFDTLNDLGGGKYTFSDQLGTTQTGTTNELGYYSIPLDTPVQLVSGNDFIVQVNLTTTGYGYPIPIDYYDGPDLNWAAIATSSGESYASCSGSQFVKPSIIGVGNVDIGIRARAEGEVTHPDIWVSPQSFEKELSPDEVHSENLTIGNDGTGALNFEIQIDYAKQQTSSAETISHNTDFNSVIDSSSVDDIENGKSITFSNDDDKLIFIPNDSMDSLSRIIEINVTNYTTSSSVDEAVTSDYIRLYLRPDLTGPPHDNYLSEHPETHAYCKQWIYDNGDYWTWDDYSLKGDINGTSYSYWIYFASASSTTFKIEVNINGDIVATFPLLTVPHDPYYQPFSKEITGLDPTTSSGDEVILKITKISGGTGSILYGAGVNSNITIPPIESEDTPPTACFTVSPTTGTVSPDNQTNINVTFNTTGLAPDDYYANINITSNDLDERVVTVPVHLAVGHTIFDTGQPENPYPSISGTHKGTITPNQTIKVSKMYTYPCSGTGGHSEYVAFYNATTGAEIANGSWTGYQGAGDYHYIIFEESFMLEKDVTYNYTIRTGSYPQIHHTDALPTANGWINCTEFRDANGKEYTDWIPAIRLE